MLTIADAADEVEVEEFSTGEARAALAPLVESRLGVSLEEFLLGLDAGEYDAAEDEEILELVMLAPFVR